MRSVSRIWWLGVFVSVIVSVVPATAMAETLSGALARVYKASPELNAQRAGARAVDENVPAAMGGFRPIINSTPNWGLLDRRVSVGAINQKNVTHPGAINVAISQNLFNGFRDLNGVARAEFQVKHSRQSLRNTEASVLSAAISAYMNVLRDAAALQLRSSSVEALNLQVANARVKLDRGEVTRTDVAQAEGARAQGRIDLAASTAALRNSQAVYKQLVGAVPQELSPARAPDGPAPKTIQAALAIADEENPLNIAARYNIEIAEISVKISKGQLLPTLNVSASISRQQDYAGVSKEYVTDKSIVAQLNVPIYEGGVVYAQARQATEKLGESRLLADQQREQVRMNVSSIWASIAANRDALRAAQEQVQAAEAALTGVREEAKFGQRTTSDVLNAQQILTNARLGLIVAQRDKVVLGYSLLQSIGRLSGETLALKVEKYNPSDHYDKVRNKWIGFE